MILHTKAVSYLLAAVFTLVTMSAQTTNQSGAVTGTITDQSGAAVPSATVVLTSQLGAVSTIIRSKA